MNAQVSGDRSQTGLRQSDATAFSAPMLHPGRPIRTTLTTHEFVYRGDHDWMLMQRCYTHTGVTLVPLKSYEVHGSSDKRAALDDAEQHILSAGGRKGQWSGTTPSESFYNIAHCIPNGRHVNVNGSGADNHPTVSFAPDPSDHSVVALADHLRSHGREDLLADLLDWPLATVPGDEMPDASDLIARARDKFVCTDSLHRDLATALEAARAQLITVGIRMSFMRSDQNRAAEHLMATLQRFRALAAQWGQPDSASDLKAASAAVLAILDEPTPDGSTPPNTAAPEPHQPA
ncbi:hypothetical protein ACNQVK_04425 [Mycobacterium sp. 134]|uniref:hypothetical protein n=1 Tax=Mycobacterium sp. 134 TaxID=3400425 RepID=UPI003AAC913A